MNLRLVSLGIGGILLIESALMAACLCFALIYEAGSGLSSWPALWVSSFLPTLVAAALLILLGSKADRSRFFRREAFAIVGLGWLISGFFAALPYCLSPLHIPFWDGLFEAYSGLTTTGATIFTDLDLLPRSLILWRSVTQWIGGLGIVILFVAVLGFFGIGNKALFHRESSAMADSDLGTRFQSLSFRYLMIYISITGVAAVGCMIFGMTPFSALNHAMCALSTGGFSPHNESIAYYPQWTIHLWLVLIMLAGGIAFPIHYALWIRRQYDVFTKNEELRAYLAVIALVTLLIALDLIIFWPEADSHPFRIVVASIFQTVSIITTTGFVSADFNLWPPLSKILLLGIMFIGGCAGSTGGGIKVSRFVVFAKAIGRHLQLVQRPHRISKLRMNQKLLPEDAIQGVVTYFALYFVLLLIGVLGLALLEPNLDLTSTLSAMISCLNNIGPGLAEVGPTENFAFFNPAGKIWLAAFMLLGRLEIYAILLLLLPSFWKKF